ncbi:MAG: tetratricopeptide repeat protein [Treponema sp.]|nr:tetratricopeptide repeat protein [Treponema sp.]
MENNVKDFFISYTQHDKQWAEWIDWTLRNAGYTTIIQAWDFKAGENFVLNMDKALKLGDRFIAVMSKSYLQSLYCQAEWTAAFTKDPSMEKALFIPIRVEAMKIEGLLAPVVYIDFVDKNEEEMEKELLDGVSTQGRPRNRPDSPGTKRLKSSGELPFHNLPENRNPHFTGRQEVLEEIHKTFEKKEAIALTQSIAGLGGIGKTQVVIEYAHRYGYEYDCIWWVNAEMTETIFASFQDFALKKGIINKDIKEVEIIIEAVRHWMQQHDNWLFIFDNAEDEKILKPYLPAQSYERRHVLITSRNKRFLNCSLINIGVFTETEACEFIEKYTQCPTDQYFKELTKKMGYLPLALDQAGAYINIHKVNYKEYLDLYNKYNLELLAEYDDEPNKKTVATTWLISFKKINNPASKQLLNLCAFFAPENIFTIWFSLASKVLPKQLQEVVSDELKYNKTIAELTKYSLVSLNDGTLYIHRLVQEVIRTNLKEEEVKWRNICIDIFYYICSNYDYDIFITVEGREMFSIFVPHIIVITSAIKDNEATKEIAQIYYFLGHVYNKLSDYLQALYWLEKTIVVREKVFGNTHHTLGTTYNVIGRVYTKLDNNDKALEYLNKALHIIEKVFGKKHPETATIYDHLGHIYGEQENYDKALEYCNKALYIFKKFGQTHRDVAITYSNIALIYKKQGFKIRLECLSLHI